MLSYVFRGMYHVFLRYCIFAGVLGSFWVMAVIDPQGPLILYMVPAGLLALPLAYLSDHHTNWEKVFSTLLLLSIIGGVIGVLIYLYEVHENHSGQLIPYVFLALLACGGSGYLIFRKRSRRGLNERRGGAIRVLWAIGILYLPILLSTIFYYRLWRNKTLESSASILFCVLAFVICLTLAIMRIFWMDALRNYRAMRVGEYPSEDAVNLLELLIPRSMFLVVMVPCLLFSEAVMFSVVYRVTHLSEIRRSTQAKLLPAPTFTKQLTTPKTSPRSPQALKKTAAPPPLMSEVRSHKVKLPEDNYRFLAWLNFVVRPYVFPKRKNGTELNAPAWIKPFGRILLSLIILLLFTHQLNIWNLFKNCYLSLYNLVRKGVGTPNASPDLNRQWSEIELNIRSLLNNYGGVWRWLILFACTSPTHWLIWKWFLDPGYAFLETVDRVYRYCKYNWGTAVLAGASFLTLITLPPALIYNVHPAFLFCVVPSFVVGALLFISQRWVEPHPPQIRSWLLPWLYPAHLVVSLIYFFVALSVRDVEHASLRLLWYICLATVIMYPILYWFGGERMLPQEEEEAEAKPSWQNSRQVRLAFLQQFYHIEYRSWVIAALTYRIHPVRSRMMSARYVLPSLQLGLFQWLRERVKNIEEAIQRTLNSITRALYVHLLFFIPLTPLVLLAVSFNTREQAVTVLLQTGYMLLCAVLPVLALVIIDEINHRWFKKTIDDYKMTPKRLFAWLSALTAPAVLLLLVLFDVSTWPQFFVISGIAYLCFFPWLAFASWRHLLNYRARQENEEMSPSKIERSSRLGHWIELLRRKENDALSHVYQKVHVWGRTDTYTRHHMCEGLVELITSTQHSLSTERWFTEEARELERVTHLWLGEGHVVDPEDMTKPAEVLAFLFKDAIDVLGSILYDQVIPERREMLAPHKTPNFSFVLRVLNRLLRLSRPPLEPPDEIGTPPPVLAELKTTLQDLEELIVYLIKQNLSSAPIIDVARYSEHQDDLLRILQLLNPHAYQELNQAYSSTGWIAPSFVQESSSSLVSSTWERMEALLRLPTPLAHFYQEIHHTRQEIEQLVLAKEEIYDAPVQLYRTQEHHILREYRKNWGVEHELSQHRQYMWENQRYLYQELLGYLLAGLKTNLPFQMEYAEWLNLRWHSPEARALTYQWLTEQSLDTPNVAFWADLYIQAYDQPLSHALSRQMVEFSTQDKCLERLETILMQLEPSLSEEAKLRWYQDIQIPGSGHNPVEVAIQVKFEGANPRINFVEGTAHQHKSAPLLRSGSLQWTGSKPREFQRLEIWIARWLLDLLWQASRSWELWVPENEHRNLLRYRQKNLFELEQLLQQLGQLLPMSSREEQETIDYRFQRISRRLALLHRNINKPADETPLETSLPYQSIIQTIQSKLQEMQILGEMRMAQLVYAGLLPQCSFQYLSDVIFAEGETLLRYQYGNGNHGTIKPMSYNPLPPEDHTHAPWIHNNTAENMKHSEHEPEHLSPTEYS